jgi:hypothetical protein
MMKKFPSRILACLTLLSSVAIFSGCALDVTKYGQKLTGVPIAAAADFVTGYVKDSDGEIVGYCCTTSCAKSESVKDFKEQFLNVLEKEVSKEEDRKRIMSQVEFVEKPPVQCEPDQSINFVLKYNVGGVTRVSSTKIKAEDLGTNDDRPARKDLKSLLDKFEEQYKNGAKLTIELTVCNGSEKAAAQSRASIYACDPQPAYAQTDAIILDELGETPTEEPAFPSNELNACEDCQPQPPVEKEIKFDWTGIL